MAKERNGDDERRLKKKRYEKELRRLQGELCKLQDWIKYKGPRE
jgi:polyphosphate kinase 2 (PPK2 family)